MRAWMRRNACVASRKRFAVRAGLVFLGNLISQPPGERGPEGKDRPPLSGTGGDDYYFLWSLERIGVIFGLKTIGDTDWYEYGLKYLQAQQRRDGSWRGNL